MRTRWDRDLPVKELLFDRWERAISLGFGDETSVYHNNYVYENVKIGEHTWIGPYTILDKSGNLTIGSYCSVSLMFISIPMTWRNGQFLAGKVTINTLPPVEIGDCCYIGSQTVITKGVNVGRQSVIGVCSF
jgi:acetyltransferase-like isoleucine patch superfamily enzyme